MTMKPPYHEIHGLICTDVIRSVKVDGAELKTSSQSFPGRRYGDILDQGRNTRKITFNARFLTESDRDTWIGHINSAPVDFEAYLFQDDRCCYIKRASAMISEAEPAHISGDWTTYFQAKAYLLAREPWMYGVDKGARYDSPVSLPVTVSDIEHEGTVEDLSGIDKLSAVGYYQVNHKAAVLISVAGDGTVLVLWDDDSMQTLGIDLPSVTIDSPSSVPVSIFAESASKLWAVRTDGDLTYWENGTWYLWPTTTNAKKVAIGLDDTVAIIGSDDDVCVWSGGSWISKSKDAKEIICVSSSEIYIIGTDDHLWLYDGSSWSEVEGTVAISKIALAQDATHAIYAVKTSDGNPLKWTGASWESWPDDWTMPADSGTIEELAVRNVNEFWIIEADSDEVYFWNGNSRLWIYYNSFYCQNFSVSCGSQSLLLCTRLLANDLFEVDRFGNVQHSYENDFDCTLEKLQHDLHGGSYVNSYCAIADGKLTITGLAECLLPFYGPIPISNETPYIDVIVTELGQYLPKLVANGNEIDISHLHVGENRIYIPDVGGEEDLFVGFVPRLCWISADNLNGYIWDGAGGGDADDFLQIGGSYTLNAFGAEVHLFNGTNWLEGGAGKNLATGRHAMAGGGSSADGIVMGGWVSGNEYSQSTEEFNGTSWSAGGNLLTGRRWPGGGGGSASAFVAGGDTDAVMTSGQTEEYNGSAWSSNGNLSRLRLKLSGGGVGTSAMVCGGADEGILAQNHDVSEGGAWSQGSAILTARMGHVADGDASWGILFGGWAGGSYLASTEEDDGETWSAGGSMLTARYDHMGGADSLNTVLQNAIATGGLWASGRHETYEISTEIYGRYGSITIDWLKAVVKRCINPEILPKVSPGDVFDLQIASSGGSELSSLEIYFRDAWWF